MLDAGYLSPKEIQAKTISRILGGQNILAIAPEGSGKTTSLVFSVLMRLKGPVDGAPRALIIVPSREKAEAMLSLFNWHGKITGLRVALLSNGLAGEQYMEAIEDGHADIVIGTPERVQALYGKALLNLRSLIMFVVDDGETIAKLNQQTIIYNLAEGLTKCQRLVFTEDLNDKLSRMTDHLMPVAELAEVEEEEAPPELTSIILYKVANHKAKLNLLEFILRDSQTIRKAVVFANSYQAAEQLYNNLKKRIGKGIGLLKNDGIDSLETFRQTADLRILVIAGETQPSFNLSEIPYIFHMEIPSEKEFFLKRLRKLEEKNNAVSIVLAANAETELIRKTEQQIGHTMPVEPLPEGFSAEGVKTKEQGNDWNWRIV